MTRQEFLDELKTILTGQIPPEAMLDAYRYYSDYIDSEVRNGKTEEQVTQELGKPSLIAKSIIAAQEGMRDADVEYTEDGRTKKIRHSKSKENAEEKEKDTTHKMRTIRLTDLGVRLLGILIFVVLILIVFVLLKVSFWFFLTFGIPLLIILGIVYLILYFFKD